MPDWKNPTVRLCACCGSIERRVPVTFTPSGIPVYWLSPERTGYPKKNGVTIK
jgi:hypothetical protein